MEFLWRGRVIILWYQPVILKELSVALGFLTPPDQPEVDPYIRRLQRLERAAKTLRRRVAETTPAEGFPPATYLPLLAVLLGPGGELPLGDGKRCKFAGCPHHRALLKKIAGRGYQWAPKERLNYLPLMREELSEERVVLLEAMVAVLSQQLLTRDATFLKALESLWTQVKEAGLAEEFEEEATAVAIAWRDPTVNRFHVDMLGEELLKKLTASLGKRRR
jgi:hypothetical protein